MPVIVRPVIYRDREKQEMGLMRVDEDTGEPIDGQVIIIISLKDFEALGLTETGMKVRLERAKGTDCNPVKRAVLATEWEPDV